MAEKTVAGYIAQLNDNQGEIVSKVRTIILEAVPEATESIKWAQPVYETNGPFANIKLQEFRKFRFLASRMCMVCWVVVMRKCGMSSWSIQTTSTRTPSKIPSSRQ